MREIKFEYLLKLQGGSKTIIRKVFTLEDLEKGISSHLANYDVIAKRQYTGLNDKNGVEFYNGAIGEFENGDRFVIKQAEWLEFYIDWAGEPKCGDQARDFYRIRNSKNIGNEYENPELLEYL